eukprot:scaffold126697_cov32-Tisochrysis_lutea.AAC.2
MGDGVVRHVDGGVRQRLNQKLCVPRHASAQTEGARARPVAQPTERVTKSLVDHRVVALQLFKVRADAGCPLSLTVLEVPLVDESHDALYIGSRSWRDQAFGLEVCESEPFCHHQVLGLYLGVLNLKALEWARRHDTLVEARVVAHVVRLLELFDVLLALDVELLAHELGREVAKVRRGQDRDKLVRLHPLSLDFDANLREQPGERAVR